MNRITSAQFLLVAIVSSCFITSVVLHLAIPLKIQLILAMFLGGLIGIFLGWLEAPGDKNDPT